MMQSPCRVPQLELTMSEYHSATSSPEATSSSPEDASDPNNTQSNPQNNHQIPRREIIHILRDWRDRSKDSAWMHGRSARFFSTLNYGLSIPIMLFSTFAGAVNFMIAAEEEDDRGSLRRTYYVQIVLGVIGMAAAFLSGILKFTKVAELHEAHNIYASEFDKLSREIRVEALLTDTVGATYADHAILLRVCQENFDRLNDRAPSIPARVEAALERRKATQRSRLSRDAMHVPV